MKNEYLKIAISKEDFISQIFLFFAVSFLGIFLFAVNREIGNIFSWETIVLVTSIVALAISYHQKTIFTLAAGLVGISIWIVTKMSNWLVVDEIKIKSAAIIAVLALLSVIFYLFGRLHEAKSLFKRFSLVYLVFGILPITAVLLFFSSRPGIGTIGEMTQGDPIFSSWQVTVTILLLAIAFIGLLFYTKSKQLISNSEAVALVFLVVLLESKIFLPEQIVSIGASNELYFYGQEQLSNLGVIWAIIYNFVIFFQLLGLILLGYVRRESWLINIGAVFLFILIFIKYFDWFFTFLDKSVFFIIAGVLLFGLGWFMERGRRYVVSNIEQK
ncbi:MAG TPA: hypothetical protein PKA60_00755 [Candidatus Paceibacterota bacterium]|nr:hypothetical protein [Candidatus Paceibacterota bacterium]